MPEIFNTQQIVSTLQNIVTGLSTLSSTISASTAKVFPQVQSTSPTATAGSIASPGDYAGFIEVTLPSGSTVKVPYFNG